MALTYEEQIKIEMEKIKEIKRKQKAEKAKMCMVLGRMLLDVFPNITPENFEVFITEKSQKYGDGNDALD